MATAIRLAARGYKVSVFEQSAQAGGKISEKRMQGFRFDTGPSLLTMPWLVEELFKLGEEAPQELLRLHPLPMSCRYFWEDNTLINAWRNAGDLAREVEEKTGLESRILLAYLDHCRKLWELGGDSFLFHSLHQIRNYWQPGFRKTLLNAHRLDAFVSMHRRNRQRLRQEKMVQCFDRYATYNGSSPFRAPATLNMIAHVEHHGGAFFPENGMYGMVRALEELGRRMGVQFHYNSPVERVLLSKGGKVSGIRTQGESLGFDVVVNNTDVVSFYQQLLPGARLPLSQSMGQRSSSAVVFYWGIRRNYPQLSLHNVLFSEDYASEFVDLFRRKTIGEDPTVYIFISSRMVPADAPAGQENWYVMVNAPENAGQNWDAMLARVRDSIIQKINRILQTQIEKQIVVESVVTPLTIEKDTGSWKGSLYGLSSNGMFSAFLRHPNFRKKYKNLYFVGGSGHPGGGIPLCLASARIVDGELKRKNGSSH